MVSLRHTIWGKDEFKVEINQLKRQAEQKKKPAREGGTRAAQLDLVQNF